ncbi:MAG: hypothetical protein JO047_02510 [Alphaproteobacteria bacterium]|nr:hypothetical protein [Alphaproteobacteria bacterium]
MRGAHRGFGIPGRRAKSLQLLHLIVSGEIQQGLLASIALGDVLRLLLLPLGVLVVVVEIGLRGRLERFDLLLRPRRGDLFEAVQRREVVLELLARIQIGVAQRLGAARREGGFFVLFGHPRHVQVHGGLLGGLALPAARAKHLGAPLDLFRRELGSASGLGLLPVERVGLTHWWSPARVRLSDGPADAAFDLSQRAEHGRAQGNLGLERGVIEQIDQLVRAYGRPIRLYRTAQLAGGGAFVGTGAVELEQRCTERHRLPIGDPEQAEIGNALQIVVAEAAQLARERLDPAVDLLLGVAPDRQDRFDRGFTGRPAGQADAENAQYPAVLFRCSGHPDPPHTAKLRATNTVRRESTGPRARIAR